ncbi:hypothetical protein BDV97DRAFT_87220 [Delphinella strobiligena]|nr:hypothetical protein BDV97DRAFT_87220 [Delphinella strobiligena]
MLIFRLGSSMFMAIVRIGCMAAVSKRLARNRHVSYLLMGQKAGCLWSRLRKHEVPGTSYIKRKSKGDRPLPLQNEDEAATPMRNDISKHDAASLLHLRSKFVDLASPCRRRRRAS